MINDQLELATGPPSRAVEPWTRVAGHMVVLSPGRAVFCSCGERQVLPPLDGKSNSSAAADSWRAAHLREAWPVLIERDGDSLEEWMARISTAYAAADAQVSDVAARTGLDKPVPEGTKFPVLTDEYMDATDRAEVLERQLSEVAAAVRRRWDT